MRGLITQPGIMYDLFTWCWHLTFQVLSVGNRMQTSKVFCPGEESTSWAWAVLTKRRRSNQQHLWDSLLGPGGLKSELRKVDGRVACNQEFTLELTLQQGITLLISSVLLKRGEPFLTVCPFHSLFVFVSLIWALEKTLHQCEYHSGNLRKLEMPEYLSGKGCLCSSPHGLCTVWDHWVPFLSLGRPGTGKPEGLTCQLWVPSGQLLGAFD